MRAGGKQKNIWIRLLMVKVQGFMAGGGIAKVCLLFIHQTLWPYVRLKYLCISRNA